METSMFGPELAAIIVPVVIFMIPIVAILTKHQQKMAEILHAQGQQNPHLAEQVEALRHEVAQLKQIVHQQTIVLDSVFPASAPAKTVESDLGQRLS
jgi:hypothetical protein